MTPRRKKEAPVIDADLDSRGAESAEIQPVLEVEDIDLPVPIPDEAIEDYGIAVPTDSTEVEPDEKAALLELLTSKQVSVTSLTEDGGRGLRLYLGKPTMSTFENMLRRSTHGVVIEPDPRREGVSVTWQK